MQVKIQSKKGLERRLKVTVPRETIDEKVKQNINH